MKQPVLHSLSYTMAASPLRDKSRSEMVISVKNKPDSLLFINED